MFILCKVIFVFFILENRDKIFIFLGYNGFKIEKWNVMV